MDEVKGLGLGLRFVMDRVRDSGFSKKESKLWPEQGVCVVDDASPKVLESMEDDPNIYEEEVLIG